MGHTLDRASVQVVRIVLGLDNRQPLQLYTHACQLWCKQARSTAAMHAVFVMTCCQRPAQSCRTMQQPSPY